MAGRFEICEETNEVRFIEHHHRTHNLEEYKAQLPRLLAQVPRETKKRSWSCGCMEIFHRSETPASEAWVDYIHQIDRSVLLQCNLHTRPKKKKNTRTKKPSRVKKMSRVKKPSQTKKQKTIEVEAFDSLCAVQMRLMEMNVTKFDEQGQPTAGPHRIDINELGQYILVNA